MTPLKAIRRAPASTVVGAWSCADVSAIAPERPWALSEVYRRTMTSADRLAKASRRTRCPGGPKRVTWRPRPKSRVRR